MKKTLLALAVLTVLSGCVVVPDHRYRVDNDVLIYERGIVYPYREQEYFWDPVFGAYFFFVNTDRRRHYMPRGWEYHKHGVPGYRH